MTKYISVGKILNFHGIRGEAKVGFTKNQEDFFLGLSAVFVKIDNGYIELKIKSARLNKGFALVKFENIDSINDVIQYKGAFLYVKENTIRDSLEEDEFLIDELIGLEVFDQYDKKQGFIIGVSNNGASDLLSIRTNDKKVVLIPFVKAIVTEVNIKARRIVINNIEGLLG